jgi:hypothetical protein
MTRQIAITDEAPINPRFADAFVIFSVTLLSLAFGAWFLLRLGLTLWAGMVAALAVYTALLSVHLVVRRSFIAIDGDGDGRASVHWTRAADRRESTPLPEPRPKDSFSFRPSREPTMAPATPEAAPPPAAGPATSARTAAEPHAAEQPVQSEAMSFELIQGLIKKLADELNGKPATEPAAKPEPANATEAMISRSVAALQTTARTMQEPQPLRGECPATRTWWSRSIAGERRKRPAPNAPPTSIACCAHRRGDCCGAHGGAAEPIHALAEAAPLRGGRAAHDRRWGNIEQSEFARAAKGSGLSRRSMRRA